MVFHWQEGCEKHGAAEAERGMAAPVRAGWHDASSAMEGRRAGAKWAEGS